MKIITTFKTDNSVDDVKELSHRFKAIEEFAKQQGFNVNSQFFDEGDKYIQAIKKAIGVNYEELISKKRTSLLFYCRMIYAKLRYEDGSTVISIGNEIQRSHSTIIYYLRKYDDELQYNKQFKDIVDEISKCL